MSVSDPVRPSRRRDSGFALVVVVFLLFAIGVSAATTYQVIRAEDSLAGFAHDSDRARSAAHAGATLIGARATRGVPNDTVFTLDDGLPNPPEVQITARRLVDDMNWEDLYIVRSIGRVTDPRYFDYPAIREVKAVARMRTPPMNLESGGLNATIVATNSISTAGAAVSANDTIACFDDDLGSATDNNEPLSDIGAPPIASLISSEYPVDYTWSGGGWSPPGTPTYPIVRVPAGTYTANTARSGQGVLIVPGNLSIIESWTWKGIVVVGGSVSATSASGTPVLRGILVAGLTDPPGGDITLNRGSYQYNSCHVLGAGQSMGALDPEPLSWWSGY